MSWASLPGLTLRYRLSGRGARTLVLLHELGGSLESFDAVAPALEDGFRVLRYDQRGAGWSEKPRGPASLADHAADLGSLLEALGLAPPFALAGVAAGAAVAAEFALARPADVAALALCAPALAVAADRRRYLEERAERAMREGMRAVAEGTLSRSYPGHLRGDAALFEAYRARFLANDPVAYAQANAALAGADLEARLGALDLPCLVLAGRHDLLRPPGCARAMAALIPGAAFDVVESGHLMSVQAPDELGRRLLAFFGAAERAEPARTTGVMR